MAVLLADPIIGPGPLGESGRRFAADRSAAMKEGLALAAKSVRAGLPTAVPLLPLFFRWEGEPYSLDKHFQFEPLFSLGRSPERILLQFARQLGKTLTEASRGLFQATTIPNFKTLYVTPLFEQARRISNDSLKPLIDQSPLKPLWLGASVENSVLRRTFANGSALKFGFAFLNADRIRGDRNDQVYVDEAQDMDQDHMPIIEQTMSGSKYGYQVFAGTPKTPDNTMNVLWTDSSQGEWCIPCLNCKKLNIPLLSHDLDKMLQTEHIDDLSADNPGTICAQCQKTIYPKQGRWVHRFPNRIEAFPGYHLPQQIAELHYSSPKKWALMLAAREGLRQYTPERYANEICGETCGAGVQIISEPELQAACDSTRPNYPREPVRCIQDLHRYDFRVLAVDWGGGGVKGISLTTLAVIGLRPNGQAKVLWGRRLTTPHDHIGEVSEILRMFTLFRCDRLVHDYGWTSGMRDTLLVELGLPVEKCVPVSYIGNMHSLIRRTKPTEDSARGHYQVNKTRSLLTTVTAIRLKHLEFFAYDYKSSDDTGLVRDFLALSEKTKERDHASPVYTIGRMASQSDDFAQAVNIGVCAAWHMTKRWPRFVLPTRYNMSRALEAQLNPKTPWTDDDLA